MNGIPFEPQEETGCGVEKADITLSIGERHFSFRVPKFAADELANGIRPA